jgi:hypothetical protein
MAAFGEDVVAVVEQLGLDQLVLIGHSMGGDVSQRPQRNPFAGRTELSGNRRDQQVGAARSAAARSPRRTRALAWRLRCGNDLYKCHEPGPVATYVPGATIGVDAGAPGC